MVLWAVMVRKWHLRCRVRPAVVIGHRHDAAGSTLCRSWKLLS
eukprot:NODE_9294_length_347_cov_1.565068.p2 GENE.NODE_9294_length_347_cov_1.565068~~NODE_9294_length_347_cov_1.565068.p2  ORF type:complete len:50 (+),score=0.93 NODE_9294_length_347_cov_1.565068:22-150(+)